MEPQVILAKALHEDVTRWRSDLGDTKGAHETLAFIESQSVAYVAHELLVIQKLVSMFVADRKLHAAVTERLTRNWPWSTWCSNEPSAGTAIYNVLVHDRRRQQSPVELSEQDKRYGHAKPVHQIPAPSHVAPLHVLRWVADGLNRQKKGAGDEYIEECRTYLPEGVFSETHVEEDGSRSIVPIPADKFRKMPLEHARPHGFVVSVEGSPIRPHKTDVTVTDVQLSWAYAAFSAVESDKQRRSIRMPAKKHAKEVASMIGTVVAPGRGHWADQRHDIQSHRVTLVWGGKSEALQLDLALGEEGSFESALAQSLVSRCGPDALRDWIGIHHAADEQGGKGSLVWTPESHIQLSGYDRLIRNGNKSAAEVAREIRTRVHSFSTCRLWSENTYQDAKGETKINRVHIGAPHGLISIYGEILNSDRKTPEVIAMDINPALYEGVAKRKGRVYTLLPHNVVELDATDLLVLTQLAYTWRAGKGFERGQSTVKAKTLWRYAGFSPERIKSAKRWPVLRKQTETILTSLSKKQGIDWSGGGDGPTAVYQTMAPPWWRDRLLHGVRPALAPSTRHAPRTAAELDQARRERGLSMRQLADALDVNAATVSRWMKRENEPLPPSWAGKLATAKVWKT